MGLIALEYSDDQHMTCYGIVNNDFCNTPILENKDIAIHNIDGIWGDALLCEYVINCISDDNKCVRTFIDERNRIYKCLVQHIYCKKCLTCIGCYVYYTPNVNNRNKIDMFIIEKLLINQYP